MSSTGVRTRAWILVQAESPYEAAKGLYDAQKDKGDDRYVLVRADVVDYVYNMVIPVDAESWDALQEAYHMIQETTKAKYSTIIPVLKHFPFPAHDAHSFITADEVAAGHWKDIIPGRQHWSPGENAWG